MRPIYLTQYLDNTLKFRHDKKGCVLSIFELKFGNKLNKSLN